MKSLSFLIPAALLISSLSVQAAITYVDAEEGASGNTYATGSPGDPVGSDTSWVGTTASSTNDTQWNLRTGQDGNGDSIFQALPDGDPSGIPELTTNISGLADGTYDVYVFFWEQVTDTSSPIQDWVISAGLTSGALTTFSAPGGAPVTSGTPKADTTGVSNAADLDFTDTVEVVGGSGNRNLFGVNLGTSTVSGGSDISVFVDMLIDGNSGETRVFYDGVGYESIPEPSTFALIALAGLGLLGPRCR